MSVLDRLVKNELELIELVVSELKKSEWNIIHVDHLGSSYPRLDTKIDILAELNGRIVGIECKYFLNKHALQTALGLYLLEKFVLSTKLNSYYIVYKISSIKPSIQKLVEEKLGVKICKAHEIVQTINENPKLIKPPYFLSKRRRISDPVTEALHLAKNIVAKRKINH